MKNSILIGLVLVFVLNFSVTSVFAQEQTKQIEVFVDNDKINFTVNPLNDSGSTLVQFKPIFEKLGLSIAWNGTTKTVTGSSKDLNITLTIGSKTVLLNGVKKQLTVEPKIIKGATMIPLRFIGEASGRDVSWDDRTKTVFIASTEDQLYYAIIRNTAYMQKEDIEGLITTLDPNTLDIAQTEANYKQQNADYDLNYKLENLELISLEKETASVKVTLLTTKIAGPDFDNNRTYQNTFLNKVNGEWKISSTQNVKIDFLKDDLKKEENVTLSDENQKQVLDLMEKNRAAFEKEDVAAYKSTYHTEFPSLEQQVISFQQMIATYDLKVTYSGLKIIQGSGNEAKVYAKVESKKISGPDFSNLIAEVVLKLNKNKDGEWKIVFVDNLSVEYIE